MSTSRPVVTPLPLRGGDYVSPATDGTGPGCTLAMHPVRSPETNPFGAAAQSNTSCWSRVNQYNLPPPPPGGGNGGTEAGYWVDWSIPVLIAAIDPDAEAELDGLNKALVSGSYLKENEGDSGPTFPVLASSDSGMDEYAQTTVQELAAPSVMPDMNAGWASAQALAPGRTVATERTIAQQAYATAIKGLGPTITASNSQGTYTGISFSGYWSVGPVDYQRTTAGALVPRQVVNRRRSRCLGGCRRRSRCLGCRCRLCGQDGNNHQEHDDASGDQYPRLQVPRPLRLGG